MSIASAILAKQQQIANAYTAISGKGGTLPATQNLTNLATAISNIPSGGNNFTTYDITNGVISKKTGNLSNNEFSNITSVNDYALYYAYSNNTGLTGNANLSSVTSVGKCGLSYCFYKCTGLTGNANLSSVTSVDDFGLSYMFYECSGITGADLSSLTTIGRYGLQSTFGKCTNLVGNIDLSSCCIVYTP